jgi:glycosyltransferase involved in cell wall biosynthesis
MIAILLATYNSERFLQEQINSIFKQTFNDWKLYIRDDGSTDNTVAIINEYINKYPEKISLVKDNFGSQKSYHNFVVLMKAVSCEYYMFCDHDDVWLPNKIELSMNEMESQEKRHNGLPILIHTDMKVVDQNLNVLSDSFWGYSRFLPNHTKFWELVCCNCVNGCTMLFNDKAKEISLKNVDYCLMHDTLVAQTVSASRGIIKEIKTPTMLYRQHVDNVIGAPDVKRGYFVTRLKHFQSALKSNVNVWRRACHIQKASLSYFLFVKARISILRFVS